MRITEDIFEHLKDLVNESAALATIIYEDNNFNKDDSYLPIIKETLEEFSVVLEWFKDTPKMAQVNLVPKEIFGHLEPLHEKLIETDKTKKFSFFGRDNTANQIINQHINKHLNLIKGKENLARRGTSDPDRLSSKAEITLKKNDLISKGIIEKLENQRDTQNNLIKELSEKKNTFTSWFNTEKADFSDFLQKLDNAKIVETFEKKAHLNNAFSWGMFFLSCVILGIVIAVELGLHTDIFGTRFDHHFNSTQNPWLDIVSQFVVLVPSVLFFWLFYQKYHEYAILSEEYQHKTTIIKAMIGYRTEYKNNIENLDPKKEHAEFFFRVFEEIMKNPAEKINKTYMKNPTENILEIVETVKMLMDKKPN